MASQRKHNFSAGPAILPEPVLQRVRDEMLCLPGVGASILEINHRSEAFDGILQSAEQRLRQLMQIGDAYTVLFMQGGSRLQFSMVPANLLDPGRWGAYLVTGSWSRMAAEECERLAAAHRLWDGQHDDYRLLPSAETIPADLPADADYLYYVSNETIQGIQFQEAPVYRGSPNGLPLVCDASSDFLSRPVDIDAHQIYYACAQKNAGPAGLTIVIIRNSALRQSERISASLPGYLSYHLHAAAGSRWNTPPVFAIYVMDLVMQWLLDEFGSLSAIQNHNRSKAKRIYEVIDRFEDLYIGHATAKDRSMMNATFRLPTPADEQAFLQQAEGAGLIGLAGHRSVGGIRASLYNALPLESVERLAEFMEQFAGQHRAGANRH